MDVDPCKGIGRTPFAALDQPAKSAGHTELASAKLILMSFSGGGVAKDFVMRGQIRIVGSRGKGIPELRRREFVVDVDQTVGLSIWKRLEQGVVQHSENRSGCTDSNTKNRNAEKRQR